MLRVIAIFVIIFSFYKGSFSNGFTDLKQPLNQKYFPLGVIGCMVGYGLCGTKESCIDDHLFGICSEKGVPLQVPSYELTDPQRIGLLETKILKLLIEGYTWQDAYTQCIVQNLLVTSSTAAAGLLEADAALPLDCGGNSGVDGGASVSDIISSREDMISPSLLAQWSLLNNDKDLDGDAIRQPEDMVRSSDIIGDRDVLSAAAEIQGGGDGGVDSSEGLNDVNDDDDDEEKMEEEDEEKKKQEAAAAAGLNFNVDVLDSVPVAPSVTYSPQQQQQGSSFLRSNKRDEIVRIHKYFDKPAVPSRRSSEPPLLPEEEEALAERYYGMGLGLGQPNDEPLENIPTREFSPSPAGEQNEIFERVFDNTGALDGGDVVDEDDSNVDVDGDGVVSRAALRFMNEIAASSSDATLDDDRVSDNLADPDTAANPAVLNTLAYVPPPPLSSRLDSNLAVNDDDGSIYNNNNNNVNYNNNNGINDDDDDSSNGNNFRSLKRSAAEKNLVAFTDGNEQNQLLPQYLLNLQKLLVQEMGNEKETDNNDIANSESENMMESGRGNRLQEEMVNKMMLDYPLPDYSSLLSPGLAGDYRSENNNNGRAAQQLQQQDDDGDDDGGAGSLDPVPERVRLWGEDIKQMPEMDYDYPTAAAISDPRFPVFKSSLKSDDSLPNIGRSFGSDNLDLSNSDPEALKNLLKDILLKSSDEPSEQSQSFGASPRDPDSPSAGFDPSHLSDIDLLQLKQAEALLRKTNLFQPRTSFSADRDGTHPKFTRLQRLGEPVNKKAVMRANTKDNSETATVSSEDKIHQATDPLKHYDKVDANYAFVSISNGNVEKEQALKLVRKLEEIMKLPSGTFSGVRLNNGQITFRISPDVDDITASTVAKEVENHREELEAITGLQLSTAGMGNEVKVVETTGKTPKYYTLTFVLCGIIATAILAVVAFYIFRQHHQSRQKLAQLSNPDTAEASKDYQDLCRQKMQSKSSEKPEPIHAATRIASVSEAQVRSPSSRSSTSSWSEEPVSSNMDISTGHIVLSYMEDHLQNQDRLDREWEALCAYEADPCSTDVAMDTANARKNRYSHVLPYNHSRVLLNHSTNASGSDYINASTITDHDPKNPAYIATQGPLPHTVADFWQMVWEQGSVVIVMLTKLTENADTMCHRYWPEEGSDLYHIYEVHLVSEHIWCDDYLVRSFYLKNLQTNETRTVTQFHFLSWLDLTIPTSVKVLLDFRRKVNKSFRGRSCPIVVHCNDGCGRTGTYILMDMVLNRMAKGAKEIDIAATLEHIRDQRMSVVKVKEQFQYSLALVAEEVHAILKALPQ